MLSRTMGVPIFQEQVIKLAMVAAGFSGGEADQLRRAMAAWKKSGEVFKFKDKLIKGMEQRGYQTEFAERIFQQICGFGEYGFPESHSASFAVLAYVSAWLKYYYPAAFYTALLNSLPMGFYSSSQLVQDAKRHNITILPVCINQSQYLHTLVAQEPNSNIQLGLSLIKGLTKRAGKSIVDSRPEQGYKHISQLSSLKLNLRDMELLASANALQSIAGNRFSARWAMMDSASRLSLFNTEPLHESYAIGEPSDTENLLEDYASMGLTLGQHPVALLRRAGLINKFTTAGQLSAIKHKSLVSVIGVVTGKQAPGTASGVTFVTLEDDTGNINVVVWAGTSRAQKKPYLTAKILRVDGILEREGQVTHVIAGRLTDLTHTLEQLKTASREFH